MKLIKPKKLIQKVEKMNCEKNHPKRVLRKSLFFSKKKVTLYISFWVSQKKSLWFLKKKVVAYSPEKKC